MPISIDLVSGTLILFSVSSLCICYKQQTARCWSRVTTRTTAVPAASGPASEEALQQLLSSHTQHQNKLQLSQHYQDLPQQQTNIWTHCVKCKVIAFLVQKKV